MEKAGKNRSDYKKVNRGLASKMVVTGQCSTRTDLARHTGLSKVNPAVFFMKQPGFLFTPASL